jgi:hypothetical protein
MPTALVMYSSFQPLLVFSNFKFLVTNNFAKPDILINEMAESYLLYRLLTCLGFTPQDDAIKL